MYDIACADRGWAGPARADGGVWEADVPVGGGWGALGGWGRGSLPGEAPCPWR